MQASADQVALAIKSAQAFEGLQASNRRLATLQRITATLQNTLPLEEVLRTVVQGVVEGLNYIGSSIKYTPNGGTVTIRVMVENGLTTVCFKDTGIGISPDHLPHIFEKFYRVETEETSDTAGTGLGLAIAKSIIEVHGGRIWAESEPGAGSTFSFTLP